MSAYFAIFIGGALLALAACTGSEEPTPQDACKEAGFAVANRTVTCGQSRDVGNARYHELLDHFACVATFPTYHDPVDDLSPTTPPPTEMRPEEAFGCAVQLRQLSCEGVLASGDLMTWWLSASPSCSRLFAAPAGAGGAAGAGGKGG